MTTNARIRARPCLRCGATPLLSYRDGMCANHTRFPGAGVPWPQAVVVGNVRVLPARPRLAPVIALSMTGYTEPGEVACGACGSLWPQEDLNAGCYCPACVEAEPGFGHLE